MSVEVGLRQTSKGRLVYDESTDQHTLQEINLLTSPKISCISPPKRSINEEKYVTFTRNSDNKSKQPTDKQSPSLYVNDSTNRSWNVSDDSLLGTLQISSVTDDSNASSQGCRKLSLEPVNSSNSGRKKLTSDLGIEKNDKLKQIKVHLFNRGETRQRTVKSEAIVVTNGKNFQVLTGDTVNKSCSSFDKENGVETLQNGRDYYSNDFFPRNLKGKSSLDYNVNRDNTLRSRNQSNGESNVLGRLGTHANTESSSESSSVEISPGVSRSKYSGKRNGKASRKLKAQSLSPSATAEMDRTAKQQQRRVRYAPYQGTSSHPSERISSRRSAPSSASSDGSCKNSDDYGDVENPLEMFQRLVIEVRNEDRNRVEEVQYEKRKEFDQWSRKQDVQHRRSWEEKRVSMKEREEALQERELSEEKERWRVVEGSVGQLKDQHAQRARLLDRQLKLARDEEQEKNEQIRRAAEEHKKLIEGALHKVRELIDTVTDLLNTCSSPDLLPTSVSISSLPLLEQIHSKISAYLEPISAVYATDLSQTRKADLRKVLELLEEGKKIFRLVENHVLKINDEAKEKKELETRKAKEEEEKRQREAAAAAKKAAESAAAAATAGGATAGSLEMNVADIYKQSQRELERVINVYKPLTSDRANNRLRFELQKLINIPINAIAATSGAHLRDKLDRLTALLGNPAGAVKGMAQSLEPAVCLAFCRELVAKRLIGQGEEQVSRNQEDAFPFAAVALGLWRDDADLGFLFLAHLYKKCPYAVPYYKPKRDDEDIEPYFKSLGYLVGDDGKIEEQDKFLGRMRGCMLLYSAIMISNLPPPSSSSQYHGGRAAPSPGGAGHHPHGLQFLYTWCCRLVNQEPRPDITATVLLAALQIGSHALYQTYGHQFAKLICYLREVYLDKIITATPDGKASGPVSRLIEFLDSLVHSGRTSAPAGFLSNHFWSTY